MSTYAIDDGYGDQITTGLSEHIARRKAYEIANRRGETVYLYEVGSEDRPMAIHPDGEEEV